MNKILCGALVPLVVMSLCGCIKSGEEELPGFRCSDGTVVDVPQDCILGRTTTLQTTTTPRTTTSTLFPSILPTTSTTLTRKNITLPQTSTTTISLCANNILDEDETIIDCGSNCPCRILNLTLGGTRQRYVPQGYYFALNTTVLIPGSGCGSSGWPTKASYFNKICKVNRFVINVTSPEGLKDTILIAPGSSYYVDGLEFGVVLMDDSQGLLQLAVRPDASANEAPYQARVFSVGGSRCGLGEGDFCTRNISGYSFRVLERKSDGVKLEVVSPQGNIMPQTWVYDRPVDLGGHVIGVLRPTVLGGYAVLYLL